MSLNSEPALPEEREAQHLPPKSYAEAAEEGLHEANGKEQQTTKARVTDNMNNMRQNVRITIPSGGETEEYEGKGLDASPKTPVKHSQTHRRRTSLQSDGSPRRAHDVLQKHMDANGNIISTGRPHKLEGLGAHQVDGVSKKELVTGKEAGRGWKKSKYDDVSPNPSCPMHTALPIPAPVDVLDRRSSLEKVVDPMVDAGYDLRDCLFDTMRLWWRRIRFAPWNVPMQRRLQTLAVLMHTLSIAGSLAIFFFLCSFPPFWPILFPYTIYVLFSNAGTSGELSFRSDRWRRSGVWSLFRDYFPVHLHRTEELEPTRKYIFGYHPHGIISHGCWAAFATEACGFSDLFPGITNSVLTLDSNFKLPLYREYALRMGLASVSKESCENILSKGGRNGEGMGRAITIVIGGAQEALKAQPGQMQLILNKRKGFVRLAINTGADIVPVIGFGENDIYEQLDPEEHPRLYRFQMLVKKIMGFTVPLFHARGVFNYDVGMMPYRRPMDIVVGRPIRVQREKNPDDKTVNAVHAEYVRELKRLWDDNKERFAQYREEELKIIE